jgi:hypothetical protein
LVSIQSTTEERAVNIIHHRFSQLLLLVMVYAVGAVPLAREASAQSGCEATQYGMSAGASDNTAAFKSALMACAGKSIHIPQGAYTFSPHGFDNGIFIPDNTNLVGDGSEGQAATVLLIADTGTFASFLWIRDTSNISIKGIRFEGSTYDSGCARGLTYGHAISVYSTAGSRAAVENVHITGNVFHNFNGQSWITMNAADRSPGIGLHSEIAVSKNAFLSDERLRGGCAGSGGIGYPVFMVWLHGSDESGQGMVENISIASNTFQADYVKGAVVVWSDTARISIQNNSISNAGLGLPPAPKTELGRYAIAVYNSAHEKPGLWPDDVQIVNNTIVNPVSCGIYVAAARNLDISRNKISGQTDRFDGTLPKAAIALNHAFVRTVDGNELANNYTGITVVAGDVAIKENRISVPPGGIRTKIFRDEHRPPEIQR